MNNVVKWKMPTDSNMTIKRFKKYVAEEDFQDALIIGYHPSGDFLISSSKMSHKDALWLIEYAKKHIMGN